MPGQRLRQAKVLLREDSNDQWSLSLFGSATVEGIEAVARRETALAIVNPSTALKMAFLGTGPFKTPYPLRTIAIIPSEDQLVFAVNAKRDSSHSKTSRACVIRSKPRHAAHSVTHSSSCWTGSQGGGLFVRGLTLVGRRTPARRLVSARNDSEGAGAWARRVRGLPRRRLRRMARHRARRGYGHPSTR